MTPAQPNNSLINGLACLQHIVTRDEPVGVRTLARELNLSPTRVSRLLSTLAHLGLVARTTKRKYKSGPGIHVLAAQSLHASPLLGLALPHLMQFREDGFTVALGVLWNRHVCYLLHERPAQGIEESLGSHQVHPAERSSIGMALLADAHAEAPPKPIPDIDYVGMPNRWDLMLGRIRRQGYATLRFSNGELSIGAVVGSPAMAALGISRKQIGSEFLPELTTRLQAAAQAISAALSVE